MGYSLLQISEILLKADKTTYRLGTIAYENMFSEDSEDVDFERDIIYIYKKAVEYADDLFVGTTKLDQVVERLANRLVIYNYGQLNPIYSNAIISNPVIPTGSVLNDLNDVTITNLQDNQILRYSASLGQWVNTGPNAAIRSKQAFTATLNQTVFVTTSPFTTPLLDVYLNGVMLNSSSYSTFGNYTITLYDGCLADDILDVTIYDPQTSILDMIGYMKTSVYDTDQDGIVDDAEKITIIGRNSTGSTIHKGKIVYLQGSTGNRPNILLAQANSEATSSKTFGVVVEDIANNADGHVAAIGTLHDLDTRSNATNPFTTDTLLDGDLIWLSATNAGYVTKTVPVQPNHAVFIGVVARTTPSFGRIIYKIQNGYELQELHNVLIDTPTDGQVLKYNATTGLWYNGTDSSTNIYNSDGTLTGNRIVTMGAFTLSFEKDFTVNGLTVGKGASSVATNTVFGVSAGVNIAGATRSVLIGYEAGKNVTTGTSYTGSVLIGYQAGFNMSTGYWNVAIGDQSGYNLTTGKSNTFLGEYSAYRVNSGIGNTMLGNSSGIYVTSGNYNTLVGYISGQSISTGNWNIVLGASSNVTTTGSYNVFIGNSLTGIPSTLSNNIILADGQGNIRIRAFDTGNVIIGGSSDTGLYKLDVTGNARVTNTLFLDGSSGNAAFVKNNKGLTFEYSSPGASGFYILQNASNLFQIGNGNYGYSIISIPDAPSTDIRVGIGVNLTTIQLSSILELSSTTKGFLPPRMTEAQRDGISSPATGLQIYNTTTNKVSVYNGTSWADVGGDNIYTADGTLTGNRTVGLGGNRLSIGTSTSGFVAGQLELGVSNAGGSFVIHNSNTLGSGSIFYGANSRYMQIGMAGTSLAFPVNGAAFIHNPYANLYFTGGAGAQPGVGDVIMTLFQSTKNITIGGTTDAGYKLDVQGTARVSDQITGRTTDGTGLSLFGGAFTISALGGGRSINFGNGAINYTGGYDFYINGQSASAAVFKGDGLTTYLGNSSGYALQLIYNNNDTYTIRRGLGAGHIPMYFDITTTNYTSSDYGPVPSGHIRIYSGDNTGTAGGGLGNLVLQHNGSVKRGNVLIGTSTNIASSIVNIESTTQGFLLPRMTSTQKSAISTPATGLVIYQTDSTEGLYQYKSTGWEAIGGGGSSIYTADGTLTGNRIVTNNAFTLTIKNASNTSAALILQNTQAYGAGSVYTQYTQQWLTSSGANAGYVMGDIGRLVMTNMVQAQQFYVGSNEGMIDAGVSRGSSIGINGSPIDFGTAIYAQAGTNIGRWYATGNLLIQTGGTFTDAGYKLDVQGTARVSNTITGRATLTNSDAFPNYAIELNGINTSDATTRILISCGTISSTGAGYGARALQATIDGYGVGTFIRNNTSNSAIGHVVVSGSSNSLAIPAFAAQTNGQSDGGSIGYIWMNGNTQSFFHSIMHNEELRFYNPTGTIYSIRDRLTTNITFASNTHYASAQVAIDSTTKGFLPPRMTTTQRDAIATPATGLQVYNTTTNENNYYDGTAWVAAGGGGGTTIYTGDGTLTSARTVTTGSFGLTFIGSNNYNVKFGSSNFANQFVWIGANTIPAIQGNDGTFGATKDLALQPNGSNVGINNTAPTEKLDVNGNITIRKSDASGNILKFNNTAAGGKEYWLLSTGAGNTPGAGTFSIFDNTSLAYRMVLTSAGRLLLGTTTESTYQLDVNGTARVSGNLTTGNGTGYPHGAQFVSSTSAASNAYFETSSASGAYAAITFTKAGDLSTMWQLGANDANNFYIFRNGLNREIFKIFESTKNVGIDEVAGTSAFSDIASAKLFVNSTTKGFLPPRMTETQLAAISSPAVGLVAYQTDGTEGLYQYKSTGWTLVSGTGSSSSYSVISVTTTHSETATSGTKIIKADTTSGAFTITLPTAVGNTATIIIKKVAGSGALTIDGDSTETIDGGTTATINKVYESITLISDNLNWQIV